MPGLRGALFGVFWVVFLHYLHIRVFLLPELLRDRMPRRYLVLPRKLIMLHNLPIQQICIKIRMLPHRLRRYARAE